MNNGTATNQSQISVIVRTLAVVCFCCVVGIFVLVYQEKKIPTELWLLTSNAMTALTAMLVKTTPTASTQDVHVTNPPTKPGDEVPVVAAQP